MDFPGLLAGHEPTRRSSREGFKSHGSGRVGLTISRFRSGRVKIFIFDLTGRVGSGQEFSNLGGRVEGRVKIYFNLTGRVGSWPSARNGLLADRASMTRELPSADAAGRTRAPGPRVRHFKFVPLSVRRLLTYYH